MNCKKNIFSFIIFSALILTYRANEMYREYNISELVEFRDLQIHIKVVKSTAMPENEKSIY